MKVSDDIGDFGDKVYCIEDYYVNDKCVCQKDHYYYIITKNPIITLVEDMRKYTQLNVKEWKKYEDKNKIYVEMKYFSNYFIPRVKCEKYLKYEKPILDKLRTIKLGDRFLCIKDQDMGFIGNKMVNKAGKYYTVIKVPEPDTDYFWMTYEPGVPDNFGRCYSLENPYGQDHICIFYDYFIDIKEQRKLKLDKISERSSGFTE